MIDLLSLAVTLAFALAARLLRSVTTGGAAAGGVLTYMLYMSGGLGAFLTLLSVFVLASVSTRIGHARKKRLGTAEPRRGRSASQVFANVAVAALAAWAGHTTGHPWLLVASAAALAEAAADTVSSELGQAASDRVYLLTSLRRVAPGTDGGISLPGSLFGLAAAVLVTAVAVLTHFTPASAAWLIAAAAVFGMFFDSLLGATLERRRLLGNNAVNFLSTLVATLFAALASAT